MKLRTIYRIDDGDMFEGTEEQLEDCFGIGADEVSYWCKDQEVKLETYERNVGAYPTLKEIE